MKKIIFFILAIAAGVFLYQKQQGTGLLDFIPKTSPAAEKIKASPTSDTDTKVDTEFTQKNIQAQHLYTATKDGQTAFELLTAKTENIKTKDYGEAGVFVTGINGIQADDTHYWAFYVNDEYAKQGVSQTVLKKGDMIKFVYEEINAAEF